jgi:hypothetical protein
MAAHTLFPNRDLNQSELAALEALIDAAGIEAVIQGLSEICGLKAEHIASNWQDTILAKRWAHWAWRPQRQQVSEPRHTQRACMRMQSHAGSNPTIRGEERWLRLTTPYTLPNCAQAWL